MSVKERGKTDLQLQLLALYLLFVVPIFALALLLYSIESERLREDVSAADLSLARAIALETDSLLRLAKEAAIAYAKLPVVVQADTERMPAAFSAGAIARQDVNLLYRLSKDGIMMYHYPSSPGSTVGEDFSFRDYFTEAKATGQHVFSKGRISPTTDRPVVTSVMPIYKNGQFDGVVGVNLELQRLTETVMQISEKRPEREKIDIIIVDSTGQVIAHSNPDKLLTNFSDDSSPVLQAVLNGEEGSLTSESNSETWLYSYTPMPTANWGVIVQHSTRLAFASLKRFQQGLIIALVTFSVGAILFWIFLSNRVINPLAQLTRYGEGIGQQFSGTELIPETIEPLSERPDQIGRLARTLLRTERSIRQRLMELTTLNKTSTVVASSLDTEQVISAILDEVRRLFHVRQCALLITDEVQEELRIHASRGLSQNYLSHLELTETTMQSPAYRAISTGQPVQVSNVASDSNFVSLLPLAKAGGYRSLLVIPLIAPHVPPAALAIYRDDEHVFTEQEVNLATSFANHAAIALEHAMLFSLTDAQLQQRVQFLSALNAVGHTVSKSLDIEDILNNAMDTVLEVMPIDACWICLQRESEDFLRLRAQRGLPPLLVEQMEQQIIYYGRGFIGQVAESGEPLLLEDAHLYRHQWPDDPLLNYEDWQCLAAAPLLAKDDIAGVLGIASRTESTFSETEVELLRAIGDQIAIAVVNARLYRRSREAAVFEERNRMAREIHDTLAQGFTGILIQLQAAERLSLKNREKALQSLQEARDLAQSSLHEARRSVFNLRPTVLESLTLDQAIIQQVERFKQETGLEANFTLEGYPSALDADTEQNLYRIAQEALTNIKRHAQANSIAVILAFEPKTVTLTIVDDGVGLEKSRQQKHAARTAHNGADKSAVRTGGLGLVGIKERVTLMGGQVSIDSPTGGGTQIKVIISK
ncbi:MAG TPA: GAF domain-containing protein [Anaerolineae bacterium]|nr:GAF domain-containing protein [Anaerolineae bacterium]MCB9108840.1 GAF domain-containing protein [Anaerolineales bacterium]HRV91925.1 GAF domain-containing protein [Anaerolineae bacterium]